jgi:hypothetical protein
MFCKIIPVGKGIHIYSIILKEYILFNKMLEINAYHFKESNISNT